MSRFRAATAGLALAAAGCGRGFSAVDPAGPQAARIHGLTVLFTALGAAVFATVAGALLYAAWRGHRRVENASGDREERRMAVWVASAVAGTVVILVTLLMLDFRVGRRMADFADPAAITIKVTGKQWWWDVEYEDPVASRRVHTANEIHIPVGRRVRLLVQSGDVIHSFWVPALHGKIDMIPGYSGTTYLRADRPGIYRGQCAEFCGLQHAHMALEVIAEPPEAFERWYQGQLRPAAPPADSVQARGQQVFLSRSCAMCHSIRGTDAGSRVGPELTHLASRRTLAAGTLPNRRGHLAGWVLDPQSVKPGARMPPNQLSAEELHALLAYLESLR